MRLTRVTFILLMALLPKAGFAQYVWQYVTESQAIQKVRQIVGDPNAPVQVVHLEPPDSVPGEAFHVLRCQNKKFTICAHNVEHWSLKDERLLPERCGEPVTDEMLARRATLTASEARQIAEQFKNANAPFPQLLNDVMVRTVTSNEWTVAYTFDFRQRHPSGVYLPYRVLADVDTIAREVVVGGSVYYPVLVPLTPALSPDDAFAAAAQQLSLTDVVAHEVRQLAVSKPDPFGAQTLYYELILSGTSPDGHFTKYACFVDAFNGALLYWDFVMGLSGKGRPIARRLPSVPQALRLEWKGKRVQLSAPPLRMGRAVVVWAGWLRSPVVAGGAKVGYEQGALVIEIGGKRWVGKVGERELRCGRERIALSAPIAKVGSRVYVPYEAISRLTGLKMRVQGDKLSVQ